MTTEPDASAASDSTIASDAAAQRYDARLADEIERRWQASWAERDLYRVPNPGEPGFDGSKPKFYCLDMFPYPSGAGLHVGHPEGYTATDIICRFKRMRGFNVLHPMGWDAFGLPAEQYAIQTGVHPAKTTRAAIDTFRRQLQRFGFSYDWSREFATIDEDYYRFTQWIWLQAYGSWFDESIQRARPIAELEAALDAGEIVPTRADGSEFAWASAGDVEQRSYLDRRRLAYIGEQTVNWCPKLGTALANEEVIDGRSERGSHPVKRLPLRQWMFRITAYADRLLADLDFIDWPESTRTMQREWIGRSEGAHVAFEIDRSFAGLHGESSTLDVFTTRPDTLFGATYMVVAPEHPLIDAVLDDPSSDCDVEALSAYAEAARDRADVDRMTDSKEKTGVFTGVMATNPATGERIPVWTADYVLMGYGTGAIMAVPAHDTRDFAFARAFALAITPVVAPADGSDLGPVAEWEDAFAGHGVATNSANQDVSLDGLATDEAKARMIEWLEASGGGRRHVNFRLRDWLFSRQRYWGEPFPVVFDAQGRHYPVSSAGLPVRLPDLADYEPVESDVPVPLLAKATDWVETTAGEAGVDSSLLAPDTPVRRETNTMPGWAGSCWYYLRYCDPHNDERFVGEDAERYWMLSDRSKSSERTIAAGEESFDATRHHVGGVDLYVGGAEHAVLHLLYARFWHKILFDLGHVSTPEPVGKLFHQGMIQSYAYQRADKTLVAIDAVEERPDGTHVASDTGEPVTQIVAKMSKSLRNVVNPDDVIAEFGADTFRLYEMYMGPLEAAKPWNTRDIAGPHRFLQRAWRLVIDEESGEARLRDEPDQDVEKKLHRTIAKVGEDIDRIALNTAIAAMIELVNAATGVGLTRDQADRFTRVLAPFAPHLAEEIRARLGFEESVVLASWPTFDEAMLVDDQVEIPVQVMGKVRAKVTVSPNATKDEMEQAALADERIRELTEGKTVRKVIVVPGKLVNLVVS